MIAVSEISARVLSREGAENSDRYLFDQDIKPAINGAMESLITALNQAFDSKKLSPENLSELIKVKIWKTNSYSRVSFDEASVGHPMWTLLAIYPKPIVNKKALPPAAGGSNAASKFMPDVSFVASTASAKRLTFEEWNENENNVFMPGNAVLSGSLAEYGYLDAADYTSSTYVGNADKKEWTIRPAIPNQFVALAYIKYPAQVTSINDSIEFPKSITEVILNIVLQNISYKENGQGLYAITEKEINTMIGLIKNG